MIPFTDNGTAVLVDNNNAQRALMRSVLRSIGFEEIDEYEDINGGIKQVLKTGPDFMFMDFDTATCLQKMSNPPNLQNDFIRGRSHLVIMMSNPTIGRVNQAISYGADGVISRPFSQCDLIKRLNAIVGPKPAPRPAAKICKQAIPARPPLDLYKPAISPEAMAREADELMEKLQKHCKKQQDTPEIAELAKTTRIPASPALSDISDLPPISDLPQLLEQKRKPNGGSSFAQPRRGPKP
ncbi:response regulator [uncultured Cohaesibacter sp.]|uniref:response regulator n=1 Tax=uncultured Cohaesibacter sp. TaxID=1002546 RepID=UPI0029C907C2|nr:response regulator [uncultured Cohaesibacter sp.]